VAIHALPLSVDRAEDTLSSHLNFKPRSEQPPMPDVRASGPLKIGALAERTGTNTPTIRYYEAIGLLPRAGRQEGGQRRYGDDDVRRLTFIRRCRDFGFSVEQVRALAALVEDPASCCGDARDIAQAHLDDVRRKLAELRALEREIAGFVERCDTTCAGGPGPDCVPLAELARPARIGHTRRSATRAVRQKTSRPNAASR
jgi:DNA-binding transcriptional MerR regulator